MTQTNTAGFTGFPADALAFYVELEADNSKVFWQANKARYEANVKQPMAALTETLGEFGPFHLFRPYNDARFAKGRPPYKTHIGAYGEREGGAGYYVQLGPEGLFLGGGLYALASDQLERLRIAIDDPARGSEIAAIGTALERKGFELGANSSLKTAPRGYPKDHPRIEYLRRKGLVAGKTYGTPPWLHTAKAAGRIRQTFIDIGDMCAWLDTHVGPSVLPPDEASRW